MAEPQQPDKAKLIIGILYLDEQLLARTLYSLVQHFGPIEINGPTIQFTFTNYYEEEIGKNLKKIFVAFAQSINRDVLPSIKKFTNDLEKKFSFDNKRRINIDPGYLTEHQVVLASAKEHPYRIYLSDGIYAQLILVYTKTGWVFVEKTFADYQNEEVLEFLLQVRKTL